jgi:aerobic carbon-monoxide dehydrogenase small subunit
MSHRVSVNVNDKDYTADVEDRTLLVDLLRDNLRLTGTHIGCIEGKCGACTILVEGIAQKSCLIFAAQVNGMKLTTVEGLEKNGVLDPVQEGFWECHGAQCGFCTSGMLMTSKWLLSENPNRSRDEIRVGISGNICRCTGYVKIVEAVEYASRQINRKGTATEAREQVDEV